MAVLVEVDTMNTIQVGFEKIDKELSRYPYCIVWTPIPGLTWFLPFIGHMGICTSTGVIRDFAGSYFVSEDNMAFGKPTKYWKLDKDKLYSGGFSAWDTAVHDASEEYKHRMHLVEHGEPLLIVLHPQQTCQFSCVQEIHICPQWKRTQTIEV
ncbi:transmembrane protein 222a isoform X6 [Electrophorus electricus]|uniref:transmembrane protein 222a isoform X6 n=1 Tax=Electrophorus electricus TaxID=8005 RepID=UPI000F09F994|nr:transmembrane protein 222a isoform X6 [Electrophorus electricus]XP_026861103.1 transmembrane protein 222a isoform X6 [Electrophorus electricus]